MLNEEKSIIKKEDIWVEVTIISYISMIGSTYINFIHVCIYMQVVKIKHPSEKANNPIDEVLFFKKSKTPDDLPITLSKDVALRKVSIIHLHIIKCTIEETIAKIYTCRPLWLLYPKPLLSMN